MIAPMPTTESVDLSRRQHEIEIEDLKRQLRAVQIDRDMWKHRAAQREDLLARLADGDEIDISLYSREKSRGLCDDELRERETEFWNNRKEGARAC